MGKDRTLQLHFLNTIKDLISPNHSFVDELAEVLNVSTDSVYRRLRGETVLNIDEISLLCQHYGVSFDMFNLQHTGTVTFSYDPLNDQEGMETYLHSILRDMRRISHITYAAIDIPIFHYFRFPELSAFKMFYWMKEVTNDQRLTGKRFNTELISPELSELGLQIYETYTQTPSIEIWTEETINSLIKQMEFYWDSGLFQNQNDALIVLQQADDMVRNIEKQAEQQNKTGKEVFDDQNFTLYHSEIEIGNNCILVEIASGKAVYLSFHTFNKIVTTNSFFAAETQQWLDNLIRKSVPISGVSQKQRYQFFKAAYAKINHLQQRIQLT